MTEKYQERVRVLSLEKIGEDIYSLWLKTDRIAGAAQPGQFLSVYCEDGSRLLPRPISICELDPSEGTLRLVYRVAGKGTAEFARCEPGDELDVTGPLGNGFLACAGEKGQISAGGKSFLIGGGIGIPPILQLAKQLPGPKEIILGYRDERFLEEDFRKLPAGENTLYIATEDGSYGTKGNVLDCIREHNLTADVLYACGPTPMLRALRTWALEKKIPAYLSLEERMACGIGACLGCVCRSAEIDDHTQVKNKRVCVEGPVFTAEEIIL